MENVPQIYLVNPKNTFKWEIQFKIYTYENVWTLLNENWTFMKPFNHANHKQTTLTIV